MKVIVTEHARRRLRDDRQGGIDIPDVTRAALQFPGRIPTATRLRGFVAASGRVFDIVTKDISLGRLVITIIGK